MTNYDDYPEDTVPNNFEYAESNAQSQSLRNKLYALAAVLVPVLAGFNFADTETINLWVDLAVFVVPEIMLVVAWIWSRKNKTVLTIKE